MAKLRTELIYSNIYDRNIAKNIEESPIWDKCYHKEDEESLNANYVYTIAFDGLKPVQVKNITVRIDDKNREESKNSNMGL